MFAKLILGLVGLLYVGLAAFCTFAPAKAAKTVGFQLDGGSGESEFLTVYGGLELAMGLFFLLPLIKEESLEYSLLFCLMLHACLVIFRTVGFFVFTEISSGTVKLAVGEWVILILTLVAWWLQRKA